MQTIGALCTVGRTARLLSSIAMSSSSRPSVLSIQSHVVHGAVGNRAATLPLQLLGVETDVLNTVQYSNHVGYGSFAGEKLTGEQVWTLLQGMHTNGLLNPTRMLTGYMGSVEAVRAAVRALPLLRRNQAAFQFWCDPVLGDNGRLYVPAALVDVYRDEVVPFADALLPNQFEAEQLSGIPIRTEADARRACDALHRMGVGLVIITSAQLQSDATSATVDAASARASPASGTSSSQTTPAGPPLTVLYSRRPHGTQWRRVYRLDVEQLPAHFAGTGDLLAALLLGWDSRAGVAAHTQLRRSLASVQAVLRHTMDEYGTSASATDAREGVGGGTRPLGLKLLNAIDDIRAPDEGQVAAPTRLDEPLRAILFDVRATRPSPAQALPKPRPSSSRLFPTLTRVCVCVDACTRWTGLSLCPTSSTLIGCGRRRGSQPAHPSYRASSRCPRPSSASKHGPRSKPSSWRARPRCSRVSWSWSARCARWA